MQPFDSMTCPLNSVNLVEAAAGTGKTYSIQNLVARMIIEENISISEIVVATFTEPAADELKERIYAVICRTLDAINSGDSMELIEEDRQRGVPLREIKERIRAVQLLEQAEKNNISIGECKQRLHNAVLEFDNALISTIHGFCRKLLSEFAFEIGESFSFEMINAGEELIHSAVADTVRKYTYSGQLSDLNAQLLSRTNLTKWVKQKMQRPETILMPRTGIPDNSPLEEKFKRLRNAAETLLAMEPPLLDAEVFDPIVSYTKTDTINQIFLDWKNSGKLLPDTALWTKIQKYLTANLNPRKNREEELKNYCKTDERMLSLERFIKEWNNYLFSIRDSAIEETIEKIRRFKKQEKLLSFDDLLQNCSDALERFPDLTRKIGQQFKAAIIDEFQDTDPAQYNIFSKLFSAGILFLVGDPRQAIYSFRGGDINTYLQAAENVPADRKYTLQTNFRSCKNILDAVNKIFCDHPGDAFGGAGLTLPEVCEPEAEEDKTPPLYQNGKPLTCSLERIQCHDTAKQVNEYAAFAVLDLLTRSTFRIPDGKDEAGNIILREIIPDDIAVLTATWDDAEEVRQHLSRMCIPAAIVKSGNIYSSAEAQDLIVVMQSIIDFPLRRSQAKAALATTLCGVPLTDLDEDEDGNWAARNKLTDFAELKKLWLEQSFYAMFSRLLTAFNVKQRFSSLPGGAEKLTNLIQLGDMLEQESRKSNLPPPALIQLIIRNSTADRDTFPREPDADAGFVTICTMHSSKGLQYPITILPNLQKTNRQTSLTYYSGKQLFMNDNLFAGKPSQTPLFQEKLRLAYVALTRAKHHCCIIERAASQTNSLNHLLKDRDDIDFPIRELDCSGENYHPKTDTAARLQALDFTAVVNRNWKTTSFSGLSPGYDQETADLPMREDDEDDANQDNMDPEIHSFSNFGKLPESLKRLRGTGFGTMIHNVMEKISFTASPEEIRKHVKEEMLLSKPSEAEISHCVQLIADTLSAEMPNGLRLLEIPPGKRRSEMQFDFELTNTFSRKDIRQLAADYAGVPLANYTDNSNFLAGGSLTGLIDLFFEHKGKYCILDWKTNLLEDYSPESLKESIAHSFYQMQYMIYLTALCRFLKQRFQLETFGQEEYEKYIGGVYYIFMRGVSPDTPGSGVFYDLPPYQIYQAFDRMLK